MKLKPPKEEGRAENAARFGKPTTAALILALLRKINNLPCTVWRAEALRLFGEFERTHNVRHLRALVRHCKGVEARVGPSFIALALPR